MSTFEENSVVNVDKKQGKNNSGNIILHCHCISGRSITILNTHRLPGFKKYYRWRLFARLQQWQRFGRRSPLA
eukprot:1756899-Rhodomonas_salina.1